MMNLTYDPGDNLDFWKSIRNLPGYPREEKMPIRKMIFESDTIFRLTDVLIQAGAKQSQPLLVVMDSRPMQRGSVSLKPFLLQSLSNAGWQALPMVLESDATGQVHTDMPHIQAVRERLNKGMGVLGVGSGTVCDITKHACYLYDQETQDHTPYVMYQTANSVSAFTSNMAPTFVEGVKRTLPSRYPDGLVCDLETLRDAPPEMTVSGVGDLLAIFVSLPDWFLAHELGLDAGHSELAFHLMGPLDAIFLEQAEGIRERKLESMSVLAKLIALGGLAMSLSHATTPMSGYEHVISHVLDLQAELSNQPLAQHGSQVALASILCCGAYQHFLSEFQPAQVNQQLCYPTTEAMHDKVLTTFAKVDPSGRAGAECWADYQIKLDGWHAHRKEFEFFLQGWQDLRGKITDLTRPPERLINILNLINAPLSFAELVPPITKDKVQYAFLSAPFYRKRLTLGDLLVYLSWNREKLWQEVWELMKQ